MKRTSDKAQTVSIKKWFLIRSSALLQALLLVILSVYMMSVAVHYHQSYVQEMLNSSLKEAANKAKEMSVSVEETAKSDADNISDNDNTESRPYSSPFNFDELHNTNADIYAWIFIPDANIDYPVVQSGENEAEDYYLNHNLDGSVGYPGCVYSQKLNAKDFSDSVTIIYGHNMKNGTMFGKLKNYKDEEFFINHPYVYVYTANQVLIYAVYASYNYSDKLIPYYFNYFKTPSDYDAYLKEIAAYGQGDKGHIRSYISPELNSHMLTLSTCNSTGSARYLVQCVLIDYRGDGAISDADLAVCDEVLLSGWKDYDEY